MIRNMWVGQANLPDFPTTVAPEAIYRYTAMLRKTVQENPAMFVRTGLEEPVVAVSLLASFMDTTADWMEAVEMAPQEAADGFLKDEFAIAYRSYERVLDDFVSEPEPEGNLYTVAIHIYGIGHPAVRFLAKAFEKFQQIS